MSLQSEPAGMEQIHDHDTADHMLPIPTLPIPTISALGLTRTYAQEWEPSGAFRELYQNWRDAIIQSHNLKVTDFTPQLFDTDQETTITVCKGTQTSDSNDILGYIRFNKRSGIVEFTNFGAVITPNSLELGYTTKTSDPRLAGRYGDGLKIAALVLCRNEYHVRICSNCCYWNFGFKGKLKNEFYYQLNRAGNGRITKAKMKFNVDQQKGKPRNLSANIWEDVSVSVGRIREHDRPVTAEAFQDWIRTIVDVHRPSAIVSIPCGNLILDEAYAGHLYIKGIRVSFVNSGDTQYRFGYNFLSAELIPNRDRRLDAHPERLAMAVAMIWEAAIRHQRVVLSYYTDLLKDHPTCADVAFADVYVTESTAQLVWTCLVSDARMKGHFYFPKGYEADNIHLIQNDLKSEPAALPNPLWKLLRKYNLVRFPFEEIYHRFQQSQEVEPPGTLFARETSRAFSALLSVLPESQETKVIYVQCSDNRPNMAFSKDRNVLYVHRKWLDFHHAHTISPCEVSDLGVAPSDEYFCHHIVEDMYKRAVLAIRRLIHNPQCIAVNNVESLQSIVRRGREKIREMPTMVQITAGETAGSLRVTWNDSYSRDFSRRFGTQVEYIVVLHSVACIPEAQRYWYRERTQCDCPIQIVHQAANFALFEHLDDQPRFPMVARFRQPAMWALPPQPLSPNNRLAWSSQPPMAMAPESQGERRATASTTSVSSDAYSPVLEGLEPYAEASPGTHSKEMELMKNIFDSHCRRMAAWKSQDTGAIQDMLKSLRADGSVLSAHEPAELTPDPSHSKVESGQYVQVSGSGGPLFILYIHDISRDDGPFQLRVTKYSLLSKHPSFANKDISEKELLLHFTDFDRMGRKEDAELLLKEDISSLEPLGITVKHVSQKPVLSDYFCRYATRQQSQIEDCFLCPVNTTSDYIPPFSALPAPSVIDLSPGDPGISAGFLEAGCRVDKGVGYNPYVHDLWKKQNPYAEVVETLDEGLSLSSHLFELPEHRLATISGGTRALSFMPDDWDTTGDDRVYALDNCRFVAEHENRTDFILLTLHWAGWSQFLSNDLTDTILVLLEQRYSVHIRLYTVSSETGDYQLLLILAAPFCTNPQWLDDTMADLSQSRMPSEQIGSTNHNPKAITIGKGFPERVAEAVNPFNYLKVLEAVPPTFSRKIATAICTIVRRIVKPQPINIRKRHLSEQGSP